MADSPRQFNAAQQARRKILAAKPRRMKTDERAELSIANSIPLFAPMPSANGGNNAFGSSGQGGLFGGAVQATGSFDFSAPGLGPSLNFSPAAFNPAAAPSPSWGGNSMNMDGVGNGMAEDPRADTTGEEAARKNKPFRMMGAPEQSPSPAQPFSNPFQPVPQSTLNQAAPPETVKSSPFQFGSTTSASPSPSGSFTFGATPARTQEQSGSNLFSFGGQSQQAPSSGSGFTFGTPPPQDKPASNIFSFGQTQSHHQPASTSASFGSTPAPTTNLFNFGQASAQSQPPKTSSIFSSTTASTQPSLNLFGQPTTQASTSSTNIFAPVKPLDSTSTSNIFDKASSQPTTNSNIFSNISAQPPTINGVSGSQTEKTPATSASNLFGNTAQTAANTSNLFGEIRGGSTTSNIFGNLMQPARSESPSTTFDKEAKENTPPTSIIFGTPKPQVTSTESDNTAPTKSIFGTPKSSSSVFGINQSTSGSSLFGNETAPSPASNLFGTPKTQSGAAANPFATLNQPAPQSVNDNAHLAATSSAALDSVPAIAVPSSPRPVPASLQNKSPSKPAGFSSFNHIPATNGLHSFNQSESILPSVESDDSEREKGDTTSIFKFNGQPSTSNLFSSMKPVDAPESAAQPAPSGMFPNLSQPAQTTTNKPPPNPRSSGIDIAGTVSKAMTNGVSEQSSSLPTYFAELCDVPDSEIESRVPPYLNEEQRLQFFAAYRIRALNAGIKAIVDSGDFGLNYEPVLRHYKTRRDEINKQCDTGIQNMKRRRGEAVVDDDASSPAKRPKVSNSSTLEQYPVQSPEKPQTSRNIFSSLDKSTDTRTNRSPTKAQPFANGSTTPKAPPPMPQLVPSQSAAPVSPTPKGKRKAEVQITQLDPEGEAAEKQTQKMMKLNGSSSGSETSNIFKTILDKPAEPLASTSPKKVFSLTKPLEEAEKPRSNPFASLSMPPSTGTSTPPAAKASPFGTGAVPAAVSNPFTPQQAAPSVNVFSKPSSTSFTAPSNPFASQSGTASPSLFSLPASSSTNFFGSKPSTAPAVSSPLAKAPSTADNLPNKVTSTPRISSFKPSVFGSAPTSAPATGTLKPPTFGAPVNFLAQFGKKADKSAAERDREEMEKAKMEDMDSDDDEAEWEAAYKEKRKARRKELDEIARNGKRFSVSDTSGSETEKPTSPRKSTFGKATSAPSSNSLLPPVTHSGASSPGLMSSNSSSVFDGLGAIKPVTFGDNIFGHLSDVDSGADSGKGNDADDDTDESPSEADEDEEPQDSEEREEPEEADDETKDATYDPKISEPALPSTPGTPTTPVEETGAGIASAKKSKFPFAFGTSSNSGTSTPGGSLFDRITRDASGNPVRQLPNEDKENAGPSSSSIFAGNNNNNNSGSIFNFSKSMTPDSKKSPGDNTWKPDSPIKFGTSTAPTFNFGSPTPPPAVNVQAPTPTKTSPFAGLFGSTVPSKSTTPTPGSGAATPFGQLFGSTSGPKTSSPSIFSNLGAPENNKLAAVGFNFGGASTATSSLLPSAAGSGVTSRATTPGGTTDGESANGDAEVVLDAQVDLASGGAGEEKEQSIFQVRAKAQKFEEPKKEDGEKSWVVKGVGNLRILKHEETGLSRILLRADPSGTIVLNKRILPMSYTATQKTVRLLVSDDIGKGMETWLLQVKTPELAKELAETLEKHKATAST